MQTLKRVVKKIGAVSTGLVFAGATMMGAMAADLSEYPAPFVESGAYNDVAVITSSNGLDANSALLVTNAFAGLITATGTSSQSIKSVNGAFQLDKSGNHFNFDDDAYDIDTKLDDSDLPVLLADGKFDDSEGTNTQSTDYTQTIRFADNKTATTSDKTIALIYDKNTEDPDDTVSDYLFISKSSNLPAWTYELKFNSAVPTADDDDLENNVINILGKKYTITDATVTTANVTKLTLLAGEVTQTLSSGQTVSGVTLVNADSTGNKCMIEYDGRMYPISNGQTQTMPDGTIIGVTDVISTTAGLPDYCELNIGADKVELENGNKVKINGDSVDGTSVVFDSVSGLKLFNISYIPQEKVYLAEGESFVDPVFNAFKIMYEGLVEDSEEIKIDALGDQVKLTVKQNDGYLIDTYICYTNSSAADLRLGEGYDNQLIVMEDDWLNTSHVTQTVSSADITELEGTRFLFSYSEIAHIVEITDIDTLNNRTDFKVLDTDSNYEDQEFTPDIATTYSFLDHNFQLIYGVTGGNITFEEINDRGPVIYTENGLNITFLGSGTANAKNDNAYAECNLTLLETDTGKESDLALNTIAINFKYDTTDETIEIEGVTGSNNFVHGSTSLQVLTDDDNYLKGARTVYGTYVEQYTKNDGEVIVKYPLNAVYGQVYVAPLSASSTTQVMGSSSSYVTLEDSEVSDVTSYNAIVVGGPAANSVAAELLGLTYPSYGTDSGLTEGDAIIKLVNNGNNVAMIVYGWEKDDTKRAAKVLESYSAYADLTGEEVSVTGTSSSPTIVTAE
jgi:hypothetical protein